MSRICVPWLRSLFVLLGVAVVGLSAASMTADEILDAVERAEDQLVEEGLLATVRIENEHSDGTTSGYVVYGVSLPNRRLMYFAEPFLDEGITYLFVDEPVEGKTETRFWLYLPVFGLVKELVSEEDLGGGFAGSSLSLSDVGGEETRADYDTTVLRQETLSIGEVERSAYLLEMTRKPDVDRDNARVLMWIDTESFTTLRIESFNDAGNQASRMDVLLLAEFDGQTTWARLQSIDESGNQSTFTYTDRRRPETEIPEGLFTADALGTFVPADWGF